MGCRSRGLVNKHSRRSNFARLENVVETNQQETYFLLKPFHTAEQKKGQIYKSVPKVLYDNYKTKTGSESTLTSRLRGNDIVTKLNHSKSTTIHKVCQNAILDSNRLYALLLMAMQIASTARPSKFCCTGKHPFRALFSIPPRGA